MMRGACSQCDDKRQQQTHADRQNGEMEGGKCVGVRVGMGGGGA